jgi:hypothetical protein
MATSLKSLKEQFTTFVKDDYLARNMQFAQTALIDVRAQRDRQFGHYATVRRGTIGMLQAMDAGIVTQSALQQSAEQLMIGTPGYWLAPAQVALAMWIGNSEDRANKALLEAMAREPNKTALFFCLVLAREQRWEATRKWIHEYVGRQDPMALSREFTVVLDAAAQGALGEQALQLVKERCITWYEQLRSAEGMVQEQSQRWLREMSRNQRRLADQFTVLPRMCPDWHKVGKWLEAATVHEQTEQWLRTRLETTIVRQEGPRQRVDGVLRNLVTAYDEDEDSLRRQEIKWAGVVEHSGDHATAEQIREDHAPADEPLSNFLTLLTTIGLTPEKAGASIPTRQLAIRLASEWIATAAHDLSNNSRGNKPRAIKVSIGDWSGELTPEGNDTQAGHSFSTFIDQEVSDEVGRVKITGPVQVFVAMLAITITILVVLAFNLHTYIVLAPTEAIAVALLITSFIRLRRARRVLPKRREAVRLRGEARKKAGLADLREAAGEVRRVFELWETELVKESALVDFIREQASQDDPMSAPAIKADGSSVVPAEAPRRAALPGNSARNYERRSGDDESFAFELPNWDLLPPPSRIDGATAI